METVGMILCGGFGKRLRPVTETVPKPLVEISDDYTIQNSLKIMNIDYSGVITEGIKGIYNWKKICEGCKKEYPEDYKFDDCEICGSKIFKKRIKVNR